MTSSAVGLSSHLFHSMSGHDLTSLYGLNIGSDLRLFSNDEKSRKHVFKLLEEFECLVNDEKYNDELIARICLILKAIGSHLERDVMFRQQMDVYFNLLRNVLRNPKLNAISRTLILEVIEIRAANWTENVDIQDYYRKKIEDLKSKDLMYGFPNDLNRGLKTSQSSGSILSQSLSNDIMKSSGKFSKPTKMIGKTFLRDEVVIRNGDSGKVMGIKGRRVAIIEELSDTVISFQKVNPGAKERLVQITGPTEENIEKAKELIETTIKRNASPVPYECSTNSFESNVNSIETESNETSVFNTTNDNIGRIGAKTDDKMKFSFTISALNDAILLSTNNYSIGLKSKEILEKAFNSLNKSQDLDEIYDSSSDSELNLNDKQNICESNLTIDSTIKDTNKALAAEFDPLSNSIEKSSSQGCVPIGKTSLRFLNISEKPKQKQSELTITYDREFLLSCAQSPHSQQPNDAIMSKLFLKTPEIVRKSGAENDNNFTEL